MSSPMIYKKMAAIMKEIGYVGKDQRNAQQGFAFRGVDQFVNALYPILVKHEVFMVPRETRYESQLKDVVRSSGKAGVDKHVALAMEYDFVAEDGSKVTVGPVPSEGLDSGDKATNKSLSGSLKYMLIQTFCVPTLDMAEADLESPEIAPVKKETPAPTPTGVSAHTKTPTPTAAQPVVAMTDTPKTEAAKVPAATVSSFRKPKAEKVATPGAPAVANGSTPGWT